ncbi:MAG: DinB family protein [Ardenticatenaceae bacterium]|nr:DinB family protein [Ardenticatenaceae bacterium]
MENHQEILIDKMFEYNLWANIQLIELCGRLSEEQLAVEAEGVFGKIHPTLVHLVQAEGGYLNRVTGSRPWADDLDWDSMTMQDLLEMAKLSGRQLLAIASKTDPTVRHDTQLDGQPWHFFNWTVVLQALYHGIEHRTQIKFLLTKLGVVHPDLDAWDYRDWLAKQE